MYLHFIAHSIVSKKVKVGNDQEMTQSEKKFRLHILRGGKKTK